MKFVPKPVKPVFVAVFPKLLPKRGAAVDVVVAPKPPKLLPPVPNPPNVGWAAVVVVPKAVPALPKAGGAADDVVAPKPPKVGAAAGAAVAPNPPKPVVDVAAGCCGCAPKPAKPVVEVAAGCWACCTPKPPNPVAGAAAEDAAPKRLVGWAPAAVCWAGWPKAVAGAAAAGVPKAGAVDGVVEPNEKLPNAATMQENTFDINWIKVTTICATCINT